MAIETKTKYKNMAILFSSIIGIKLFLAIETLQNHFISYLKRIKFSFFGENFATVLEVLILKHALCEQKACSKIAFASPLFFF